MRIPEVTEKLVLAAWRILNHDNGSHGVDRNNVETRTHLTQTFNQILTEESRTLIASELYYREVCQIQDEELGKLITEINSIRAAPGSEASDPKGADSVPSGLKSSTATGVSSNSSSSASVAQEEGEN